MVDKKRVTRADGKFITVVSTANTKVIANHKSDSKVKLVLIKEDKGVKYVAPNYYLEQDPGFEGYPLEEILDRTDVWELV